MENQRSEGRLEILQGSRHTYVDVPLTSGIGSSEYSLI